MVYKVPQFIEVEDKIFGPLSFKQFIYVAGGGAASFLLWTFLPAFFAIILILPVVGFALALAFYRVNNRPFVIMIESFMRYQLSGRLYLWKHPKENRNLKNQIPKVQINPNIQIPKLSESKLKDLAWSLDVNETIGSS